MAWELISSHRNVLFLRNSLLTFAEFQATKLVIPCVKTELGYAFKVPFVARCRGATDAEITVPSGKAPDLLKVLSFNPGVDRGISSFACFADNSFKLCIMTEFGRPCAVGRTLKFNY